MVAHLELTAVGFLHSAGVERRKGVVRECLSGLDLSAEERALGMNGVLGEELDTLLMGHLAALHRLLTRDVRLLAALLDWRVVSVAAIDFHHARLCESVLRALGVDTLCEQVAADAVGGHAVRLVVGEARCDGLDGCELLLVRHLLVVEAAALR
eukprot:6178566-Pleurochrysis_carterae.AAC.2